MLKGVHVEHYFQRDGNGYVIRVIMRGVGHKMEKPAFWREQQTAGGHRAVRACLYSAATFDIILTARFDSIFK